MSGQEMGRSETGRALGRRVFYLRTDKDAHFTGAVAIGDTENETLTGLGSDKVIIRRVVVEAIENRALTIAFFAASTFQTVDLDTDAYLGEVQFLAADGVRMNAATYPQYVYDSGELNMPYIDAEAAGQLNVAYVCRDAAGKAAGAAGYVTVRVVYEVLEED